MAGTFQVGGLISGLDTNKLIEQLMNIERRPLVALQKQQEDVAARKTALSELSSKLRALSSKAFNLSLSANAKARSASSSNTNVATATATSSAAVQSFTVNVSQLATRSYVTSPSQIGDSGLTAATALSSAKFSATATAGTYTVKVGASTQEFTISATTETIQNQLDDLNAAGFGGGFTATFNAGSNTITLTSTQTITVGGGGDTSNFLSIMKLSAATQAANDLTSTGPIGVVQTDTAMTGANFATAPTGGAQNLTINGTTITYDASSDSLNTVISRINSSGATVTASYDAATDKFTLRNTNTGATVVSLSDSGDLLTRLKVTSGAGATQTLGANAQYTIDGGATRYSTSNTVTDAVTGVTLTFNGTTATDAKITISQDTTTTVTAVKDFATAYNDVLTLIRQQTSIDTATNKRSIFAIDSFLTGIERQLRTKATTADSSLSTAYLTLTSIGVSFGSVGSTPGTTNSMVVDETALTAALQAEPTAVANLLTSTDSTNPINAIKDYIDGLSESGGPFSGAQDAADTRLRTIDSRILTLQERLAAREQSLVKKFSALEEALGKLQTQSAQLTAQLSQLSSLNAR